jgi:hypothetical protein
MKFFIAGVAVLAAGIVVLPSAAQTPGPSHAAQQTVPSAPKPQPAQKMAGQLVFSRSAGLSGNATATIGPAAPATSGQAITKPVATNAERRAIRFTAYRMDVHLETGQRHIGVRAFMTVRNGGAAPLRCIPLQISSSLRWDRIRVDGRDVQFPVATLDSDADHTGQLHEAAVPLATPLAPGQTVKLDVTYSGDIVPNSERLLALGAPKEDALSSDWDGIGVDFTGLRGFGNVVWYPVSSVPALLGNGAQLFDEIGRQKLDLTGASFSVHLTVEFPQGKAPNVAVIDGRPVALTVSNAGSANLPGVATASLAQSALGFQAPSLFVAIRHHYATSNMDLWTVPADDPAASAWSAADAAVTPFLMSWFGNRLQRRLTVLDLPDTNDAPFEDGAFLATGVLPGATSEIEGILVHSLTHAFIESPRAWLNDGVAQFMSTLWIEQQQGRAKALESLEPGRQALALIEPSSPGMSPGQPLLKAYSPAYYRTKAVYVLWMLRELTSDQVMANALRAYCAAEDARNLGGKPIEPSFQRSFEQADSNANLSWLFAQWVDADDGLPDLRIDHVYPSPTQTGEWLVAVDMSNSGYASAEVPLTVRSASTSISRFVMIPARQQVVQRILIMGRPTQVVLNNGSVPEVQDSYHVVNLSAAAASAGETDASDMNQMAGIP